MSIIPGYKHDVFVSYAHIDNEQATASTGWVGVLVDRLQRELQQRLGSRDVKIWRDQQLDGNRPLTPAILEAVRASATLLVVMSPAYLNSEWCKRERDTFLELVKQRVNDGSVFIVHARDVERASMPSEFGDLEGFRFWTLDKEVGSDRPLGIFDPGEPEFVRRIFALSHKLKEQLYRAQKSSAIKTALGAVSSASVFLARTTEDLEEREEDLRTYLEQQGYQTLPRARYPQDSLESYEAAMLRDLEQCRSFVQLLSNSRGRELDFGTGKRSTIFQHEVAEKSGVPRLLWRDRGIDLNGIRDGAYRALVDRAQASGIEEFKRAILESLREKTTPLPVRPEAAVFVNADAADHTLAADIGRALARLGVDCFMPLSQGKPEAIRVDRETNLRECDGVLLVYGQAGPDWVRQQFLHGRKVLRLRERPPAALALLEGPPPDKDDLALASSNLKLLDCRNGINIAVLQEFARQLRG
jgi:hypothetical protein